VRCARASPLTCLAALELIASGTGRADQQQHAVPAGRPAAEAADLRLQVLQSPGAGGRPLHFAHRHQADRRVRACCGAAPNATGAEPATRSLTSGRLALPVRGGCRERTVVTTDLAYDPTLPRSNEYECPKCGERNVIYFQASRSEDAGMELFFCCQECSWRWKSGSGNKGRV